MTFFRILLQLTAFAAVGLTALLLLGRFSWPLELLTHFRLPSALGFFLLGILLAVTKAFRSSGVVALCFLIQLVPLSRHYLPFTKDAAPGAGSELKIISFNILRINTQYDEVVSLLLREDPDLICLQEVNRQWVKELHSLQQSYPYSKAHPTDENTGLQLFSKFPLTQATIHTESELGTPYMTAEVDWNGQPVTLINAHPYPPMNSSSARHLKNTFRRIRSDTAASPHPTIVVGDFNCSTYAPSFRLLGDELKDSARGRGYVVSWQRGHPLLGIPIDQLLYSPDLVCRERRIGPKCGSDHSPVIATLQRRAQQE